MLPTTQLLITDHARQRYRERFAGGQVVPDAVIEDEVRNAQLAGKKTRKKIRQRCRLHRCCVGSGDFIYLRSGTRIFVINVRGFRWWALVTCWDIQPEDKQCEQQRVAG